MLGDGNRGHWHLIFLVISLACLYETVLSQTFHFSRGWTNGKKRSSLESFVTTSDYDRPEIFGLCHMEKLREILQLRHMNQDYLPCEVIATQTEPEIRGRSKRRRRSGERDEHSAISDSFTEKPN